MQSPDDAHSAHALSEAERLAPRHPANANGTALGSAVPTPDGPLPEAPPKPPEPTPIQNEAARICGLIMGSASVGQLRALHVITIHADGNAVTYNCGFQGPIEVAGALEVAKNFALKAVGTAG